MKKDDNELVILKDGDTTRVGRLKNLRFDLLLVALTAITKSLIDKDNRLLFHKIAWSLGEAGEVEACAAIMKEAAEPEPPKPNMMYSWIWGQHSSSGP